MRILIADDHELFRESLATLLRTKPEVGSVATTGSLDDIAQQIRDAEPSILLLDLSMQRPASADIPVLAARTRVIVISANEQADQLLAAVRAGARGVVSKAVAVDTLMAALHAVVRGNVWLSPVLQAQLVNALADPSPDRLTTREREVVRHVALGLRNAEVAAELYISPITVKTHLGRIFSKLGIRDRAELVLYAVRSGLIGVNEKVD
jgi:DNA-binding NarL/FixJ family response regulator